MLVLLGAMLCVATNTKIDPDLASLIKWIVGLYFTGNVAQKTLAKTAGAPNGS